MRRVLQFHQSGVCREFPGHSTGTLKPGRGPQAGEPGASAEHGGPERRTRGQRPREAGSSRYFASCTAQPKEKKSKLNNILMPPFGNYHIVIGLVKNR